MAWKQDASAIFTGASGQMAVMAELLHRKCNAAVPHVDIGTDLFAFRDDREDVARIQVKTAAEKRYKAGQGYSAKFGVPIAQLDRTDDPPLFYALAARRQSGWEHFIVISRTRLQELWNKGCGSENRKSGDLELHVQFRSPMQIDQDEMGDANSRTDYQAFCGTFDLTEYLNAWESLPPLKALDDLDSEPPQA